MKKGFTLIELLAVIVILAVIALIATPIIINIINDSRKQAVKSSAELYVDGLVKQIAAKNMINEFNPTSCTITSGSVTCDGISLDYQTTGKKPTSGTINFNNGVVTGYSLYFDDYTVTKDQNGIRIAEGGSPTPFTGTIYRVSADELAIGDSIASTPDTTISKVCGYAYVNNVLDINSCDEDFYYNTIEECNADIEGFEEEEGVTYSCGIQTEVIPGKPAFTNYKTTSPLTTQFVINAYCLYNDEDGNSCDENFGFLTQQECEDYPFIDGYSCIQGTLTSNFYLKHEVENDIIVSTQACIIYDNNGTDTEVCLSPSNYGSFDGMSSLSYNNLGSVSDKNPSGSILTISNASSGFKQSNADNRCYFGPQSSHCDGYTISFGALNTGEVYANGTEIKCSVSETTSSCYPEKYTHVIK